jgi:tight adherence protein B
MTAAALVRSRLVAVVLGVFVVLSASPAAAQVNAELRLFDARLSADGSTTLIVGVEGIEGTTLPEGSFRVLEDGQEIDGLEVEPLTEVEETPLVVALAFDVSGSVSPVFDQIQAAATTFVRDVAGAGAQVALIPFSFEVTVAVDATTDVSALEEGIAGLEPAGRTLLYDSILVSAEVLERSVADQAGITHIVVFSDGGDNGSESTLDDAVAAAQRVDAPITTVAWETDDLDPEALAAMAEATGGTVVSSEDAADIEGLFRAVAADITNQYVIRYSSEILEPAELPMTVIVDTPAGEARVDSLAINVREQAQLAPPTPEPSVFSVPRIGFLATSAGLWLGMTAAFLAVLAILWILLVQSRRTAGSRTLERGLRAVERRDGHRRSEEIELPTSRLTERAIDLVGRVPKPEGFDQRLQLQLDRAAWPVRTNEFLTMCLAAGLLGGLLGFGLSRSLSLAVLLLLLGGAAPVLVMRLRIERRRRAFMDQLPATLQLLAGSLRAGYGLVQAIDTVVKEADDPTSTEFARVLTETRLGMPIDEALEGMAQRLDSDDFHWVVLAIGIQREVGGNLAELLSTVAATMRNRAALRRQIRTLSAEGRISAWIIGGMPFFVAFALQVINPGYLSELFERTVGLIMLAVGALLLVAGAFWLKKIVDIEV